MGFQLSRKIAKFVCIPILVTKVDLRPQGDKLDQGHEFQGISNHYFMVEKYEKNTFLLTLL
jgi:hypothetical protein